MSDHKSASRKFMRDDEDPNTVTPPLPHDAGSPSSDTSISSDPFPPRDERPRSSDSAPATPEASDEVRLPGAEPTVFADPPVPAGDTRLVSSDGSASAVRSTSEDVQSPSSNASKDLKETELSPWLIWYLHKDIEWRKRLQEQRESRSRRSLQREMSALLKAKQKAEAERVFRSWCKAKTEEKREVTLEKQRRQEELEADKLRKKHRLRELSKQKYREWLETKKERGESCRQNTIVRGPGFCNQY
ncbi:unnamed protein product [Ixodes pacificus]